MIHLDYSDYVDICSLIYKTNNGSGIVFYEKGEQAIEIAYTEHVIGHKEEDTDADVVADAWLDCSVYSSSEEVYLDEEYLSALYAGL